MMDRLGPEERWNVNGLVISGKFTGIGNMNYFPFSLGICILSENMGERGNYSLTGWFLWPSRPISAIVWWLWRGQAFIPCLGRCDVYMQKIKSFLSESSVNVTWREPEAYTMSEKVTFLPRLISEIQAILVRFPLDFFSVILSSGTILILHCSSQSVTVTSPCFSKIFFFFRVFSFFFFFSKPFQGQCAIISIAEEVWFSGAWPVWGFISGK